MKTPYKNFSILWLPILFSFSCEQAPPVPVEFAISQGVFTNMDFTTVGIQLGEELPDIPFYTLDGEILILKDLDHKRPILLISGSYTCDITRAKLPSVDEFYEKYKNQADIYLINTLEAHPQNSPSPYSMSEVPWIVASNIDVGIAADQPKTIEDRIALAEKWRAEAKIKTPMLVDGAKNEFWYHAGQAPNMALLISISGAVVLKQAWFNQPEIKKAMEIQLKN